MLNLFTPEPTAPAVPLIAWDANGLPVPARADHELWAGNPTAIRCYMPGCHGRLYACFMWLGFHGGVQQKKLCCPDCHAEFADLVIAGLQYQGDTDPCPSCAGTGREPEFGGGSGGGQAVHTVACGECEGGTL